MHEMNQQSSDDIYVRKPDRILRAIQDYAHKDYYWGIAERERMREFIGLADKVGYQKAREQFDFRVEKLAKFRQYIDSLDRADFLYFLPLSSDATILDLGSGYGNITIPLARHFRRVVAVDTSLELLEFIRVRAQSEGLTNIEYVHADPFEHCNLPFRKGSFDAVIVSGVLEWIGAAKLDEAPDVLQKKFMTQIRSLVRDTGCVYVAIENRWFPDHVWRDPHSKLRYTAQLPRRIADWYARRHGLSDGYRTYIYGYGAYMSLLAAAGFKDIRFAFPFPGYRNPQIIWEENAKIASHVITSRAFRPSYTRAWRLIIRVMSMIGRPGQFLSSFMMIARPYMTQRRPFLFELVHGRMQVQEGDRMAKVRDEGTRDCATFLVFHDGDSQPYARVRVSRDAGGASDVSVETHHVR